MNGGMRKSSATIKQYNNEGGLKADSSLKIRGTKSVEVLKKRSTSDITNTSSRRRLSNAKSSSNSSTKDGRSKKELTEQEKCNQELMGKIQELELLQRQCASLEIRLNNLTSEKNGYVNEIGNVRNSRVADIAKIKNQLDIAQARMQENRTKLGRVEQIENGILQLYLEMKERGTEIITEADKNVKIVSNENEIEDLKKENPLVVLDALKNNLRLLLAFKDDYENELKDQIRRRKSAAEIKLDQLKKKIMQLEKDTLLYKSNAEKAIQIKDEALLSKELISNQSEKTLAALEQDKQEMLEMKRAKDAEIQKLRSMLDRRDEILRHREIQMMKITQLQTQIEKNKILHRLELNSLVTENSKVVQEKEKQLAFYNKVKAEKKELQLKLKNLVTTLNSYKHDANRSKVIELQEREGKINKKLLDVEEQLKEAREELEKADAEAAHLMREHEHLSKEAEEEAEKIKKRRIAMMRDGEKRLKETITEHYHDNMERNPQLAAYYKKKLKEKEKEFSDLTKQVRKMILADHGDVMSQRNYEMEIFQLIGEIEKIKRQTITRTVELDNKPEAALRKRNRELEMQLEDYEGIETQARTQAVAFERLLATRPDSPSF